MVSAYGIALGVKQRLYPYEAAIKSALGIADEYCVVYDPRLDDKSLFTEIDDRVVPIQHDYDFLEWDFINVALTKARRSCKGDFCLYLEMDEVLHEKDTEIYARAIRDIGANIEAINIGYLNLCQDYIILAGSRQKITRNIPEIYHKTAPYMIGKCDSPVWDGCYILGGYDDVSYYDSRTEGWFNDPNGIRFDSYDTLDMMLENHPLIWHYAWYNLSRKHEQGRQNAMWQSRTYARSLEYNPEEIIRLLQEHVEIKHIDMDNHIGYLQAQGYVKAKLKHPNVVESWLNLLGGSK